MKLVVFGLSVTSSRESEYATLWRGLLRSLAADGHTAVLFERETPYHAEHGELRTGDGYDVVVYPTWDAVAMRAARELADADTGIVTSSSADARAACDLVLGSRTHSVYYDLDTSMTLEALARGEAVPQLPAGGLDAFDLVLGYSGGRALDALKNRLGARRVAPLYASVDLATHGRGVLRPSYANDLSYLGTYAADRRDGVERLFFETARALPEGSFLLGGPSYPPDCARPANVTWLSHVPRQDHPAFYGSSRATLNITRAATAALGHCPSRHLFEAAACGAPVVTDAWDGLDELFEPGREILVARDSRDVLAALSLRNAELRVIARRARERVLAEHTAEHRARELVGLITRSAAPSVRKVLRAPRRSQLVTCDRRARRTSRA